MPAKVSVVIPAHNAAPYLPNAFASLRRQTMQDFEVIVVDDGSTDDTASVLASFLLDPRIRYIRQDNLGPAGAKNTGAHLAEGVYLAFLDADDELAPEALESMYTHLEATGAAWCITDIVKKTPSGSVVMQAQFPKSPAGNLAAILRQDFVTRGIFFRKTAFVAMGMYDVSFRIREDWDIHIRMFEAGQPFVYLPQPLYFYYDRSGSITKKKDTALNCTERLFHKHQKRLARSGSKVFARIYAEDMWELARWYVRATRNYRSMLRCLLESLRYDFNLARLFHPLVFRCGRLFRRPAGDDPLRFAE